MTRSALVGFGVVFAALLVLGLFVWVWYFAPWNTAPAQSSFNGSEQAGNFGSPLNQQNGFSSPSGASSTARSVIVISASNGTQINVSDFLNAASTYKDPFNRGQHYLGYHFQEVATDTSATSDPPYVINYFSGSNFFNVALYEEPLGKTRQEAEQYLMTQLGITQGQMCQLKYSVGVPYWVNQFYAGQNLGFSFCPGATTLP